MQIQPNPVIKIDPRTKLFLLLVINITMINGGNDGAAAIYKPIFAGLPLILLLTGRRIKAAVCYAAIFLSAWLAETFLLGRLPGIFNMILALFTGLFIRWFPCGMMGFYLLATTKVSEFVAAMERLHISQKIIIPLSVMFRFFPTVREESSAINNAMKLRDIRVGGKGGTVAVVEYRIIPLMMSVVKIGDELSASALTRGLGGPEKRTNVCRIGFGIGDILLFLLGISGLVVFFVF